MKKLVENVWDYTQHAQFYEFRPNYAPQSINMLVALLENKKEILVADIGAGTGNLTLMLLARLKSCCR